MVQDIDFLPASYKHERERSRKRLSRRITLVVFLSLIVAGTWQQRRNRLTLEAQRDRLQLQAGRMLSQLGDPEQIKAEIRQRELHANLLAHLRLRVSATRVLAAVVRCLPKYVSLTRCELNLEEKSAPRQVRAVTAGKVHPENRQEAKPKPPAERDLQAIRDESDHKVVTVSIEGLAPNDLAISSYIAALHDAGLFDDVQLQYSDTYEYGEHQLRSFEIRLQVRRPRASSGKPAEPPDPEIPPSSSEVSSPIAAVGPP